MTPTREQMGKSRISHILRKTDLVFFKSVALGVGLESPAFKPKEPKGHINQVREWLLLEC